LPKRFILTLFSPASGDTGAASFFLFQFAKRMKNAFRLLPLAALLAVGSAPVLVQAAASPTSIARTPESYDFGVADGSDYAADAAAQYGYGSSTYKAAIDAQVRRVKKEALTGGDQDYYNGYVYGLNTY
jgi:hypothetical protein